MDKNSNKRNRFKRLVKLRGERTLKDIQLIGNLSNRNNYEYTDEEIRHIFTLIEGELRITKSRFLKNTRKEINF